MTTVTWRSLPALFVCSFLLGPAEANAASVPSRPNPPEATSRELGPSWDPRPAWQRYADGSWRSVFERRAVEKELPSTIVPVATSHPFRIPRAMMPVATEMAPELQPIAEPTPGEVVFSPCKKNTNYMALKSTAAEDKQFVANLEKIIDVLRRDPMMPPPGIEISMSCGYERRTDGSGIYQGKITLLFYPFSDKNHYWHGGLEILVNDIGVMGPRNNAEDRASDPTEVFDLPSPAKYLDYPYLKPENRVWGGLYLSKRPQDIYSFVTYREWLAHNLPRLEAEYNIHKANAEAHPSVHYQVVRRNFQSMYERSLFT